MKNFFRKIKTKAFIFKDNFCGFVAVCCKQVSAAAVKPIVLYTKVDAQCDKLFIIIIQLTFYR